MRLLRYIRIFLMIGLAGLSTLSCDNELIVQLPGTESLPVVYSVLELHRDTLCVRVTKTFSVESSALDYTTVEDSLYYPEARVWLEKWNGNLRVNKAELTRINSAPRENGIFTKSPNWNYILVRSTETETIFTGTVATQEYHLTVEIPGKPLIFAKTMAYSSARLTAPRLTATQNLFLNPLEFAWKSDAPYTELYFKLLYTDVFADTSMERVAIWREYHTARPNDPYQDFIFGQDIMKRIAGNIKADARVDYRHITGFQAVVVGIPTDLFDYRLMAQAQPPDQAGYIITNIVNGLGMFTSQTLNTFDLNPDPKSRDSIMSGQYTKHLNFKWY